MIVKKNPKFIKWFKLNLQILKNIMSIIYTNKKTLSLT